MQFKPDIEKCIRNKWLIRKIPEPRRTEVLKFFHGFRKSWHLLRAGWGNNFPESKQWLKRRCGIDYDDWAKEHLKN